MAKKKSDLLGQKYKVAKKAIDLEIDSAELSMVLILKKLRNDMGINIYAIEYNDHKINLLWDV